MQRVARVRARPQAAAHAKRSQGRRTKSRRNTPIDGNREGATEPRAATTTGTCAQVGAADYGHAHHMQVGRRCRHASYRSAMVARPHAGNAPATRCWREGSADRAGRCDACGRPRHAAGCARARPPTGLTAPRHARRFFRKVKGRTDGSRTMRPPIPPTAKRQAPGPQERTTTQARSTICHRTGIVRPSIPRAVRSPLVRCSCPRPRGRDCDRAVLRTSMWTTRDRELARLVFRHRTRPFLHFLIDSVWARRDRRLDKLHLIDREARGADACARESHVGSFLDDKGQIVRLVARRRAENSRDRTATRAGRFGRKVIGNVER